MAVFSTGEISVNEVVSGFIGQQEPSMGLLDVPSAVPQYWRVYNRTAISTTDTGERSLYQFQGGAFDKLVSLSTLTAGQGPDESGLFANTASVWGYNVVSGSTTYGSTSGDNSSDEGWTFGQVACMAEKVAGGDYGILVTVIDWDQGPLFYDFETSDCRLYYSQGGTTYLYSASATSDNTIYYSNHWLRQIWWNMGTNASAPNNPWANASFSCSLLRSDYGT